MQVKNYSYFVREDQVQNRRHSVSDGKNGKAKNGGKSIDARSMASVTDPIAAKKAQVRKKAMKIIGDAFAGESKIDDDMANRREKIRSLTGEIGDSAKAISDIEASRAALQDKFGVSSDSQEQKDLELLAKGVETGFSGSDVRLTKEEEEQIAKIKAAGLTEYQQQSLALKKSEESYVNELADARNKIQTENAVIRQTKIERLKSNSMGAAFEGRCSNGRCQRRDHGHADCGRQRPHRREAGRREENSRGSCRQKEGTGRKTASQKRRKERAGRADKRYRGSCEQASRWYRQRSSGPAGDQGYDEQIKTGRR